MNKIRLEDIAAVLGVTRPRVSQLKAKGMPTNSIDLAADWYRKHIDQRLSPKLTPSPVPPAAADTMKGIVADTHDINVSRAKREHHEANMAELRERQALADLVEVTRVTRVVTSWAAMARSALERVPDKLSERLAATTDAVQCHALLTAEIDQVLAELASGAKTMRFDADGDGRD